MECLGITVVSLPFEWGRKGRKVHYLSSDEGRFSKFPFALGIIVVLVGIFGCADSNLENPIKSSGTNVTKNISIDTVWKSDHSPYIVTTDVTVERNATLAIQPETEIRFDGFVGLIIKGNLIADGTNSQKSIQNPIVFTSNKSFPEIGAWKGIKFENTNEKRNLIKYAKIAWADIGVNAFSSLFDLINCSIQNNRRGIQISESQGTIANNLISNNTLGIFTSVYWAHTSTNRPIVTKNLITKNETGIIIRQVGVIIKENNFISNLGYAVRLKYKAQVDATHNWWGTINTDDIENQIYDQLDDARLGRIKYIPFAESEILNAGPRQKR